MLVCGDVYVNVCTGPGDRVTGQQFKLRNGVISIAPIHVCI